MTKIRLLVLLLTFIVVGGIGTLVFLYAQGYRLDQKTLEFSPNGLFVIKSVPDSAQVIVNGELKTATNATVALLPATYDIMVKKDGYRTWSKRITIEKEVVSEATAYLFKSAPSLSPVTFFPSFNPVPSSDFTKISYIIPPDPTASTSSDRSGLWIIDMVNLPLGFARDPRRVTDGDLTAATWSFSPDNREILLKTKTGLYLLATNTFTPQTELINIAAKEKETNSVWQEERQKRTEIQLRKLPDEIEDIFARILYTASTSATLEENLVKPLPGSSYQRQERDIKAGRVYIYDIKEDRNFLIDEEASSLDIEAGAFSEALRRISWFPTSRHLILAEPNKITIMDYDGTNRQEVYAGSYVAPHAYPALTTDRIIILTNLGANTSPPNLYSLSLK